MNPHIRMLCIAVSFLCVPVFSICAQEQESAPEQNNSPLVPDEVFAFDADAPWLGAWIGSFHPKDGPVTEGLIAISLDENKKISVALTAIHLLALEEKCTDISTDELSISFTVKTPTRHVRFDGEISEDGQHLAGDMLLVDDEGTGTADGTFEFRRTVLPMDLPDRLAFNGKLDTPGPIKLDMTFVFAQTPGGNWVGHVDVPLQTLINYPLTFVQVEPQHDDSLSVSATILGVPATIETTISETRQNLTGVFRQMGLEIEFNFVRDLGYAGGRLSRPQEPKPPYPYEAREVVVSHPDGHTLAGTLTIPEPDKFGEGPHPAVVMITGSGPQDRDESLLGHKPFAVLADHLTRQGIAVLRYDDRGTAGSTGDFASALSTDFATDAWAAVQFLHEVEAIDRSHIGLIGHSEGGVVAPMVAADHPDDIDFIVMLAGTGVPGDEIIRLQARLIMEAEGIPEERIEASLQVNAKMMNMLAGGVDSETIIEEVKPDLEELISNVTEDDGEGSDSEAIAQSMQMLTAQLDSAWLRTFLTYDPRPTLAKVRCPILALNGTLDLQVWHEQNLPEIEKAVRDAGGNVTVKSYENRNHLFQPAEIGTVGEYVQIEITMDPIVMDDIAQWIREQVK